MNFPTHQEASQKLEAKYRSLTSAVKALVSHEYIIANSAAMTVGPYMEFAIAQWGLNAIYHPAPQLCNFTECGEDGKPMQKPTQGMFEVTGRKYAGCSILNPDEAKEHGNPRYYNKEKYSQTLKYWQAAQNKVLFEGWEIKHVRETFVIMNKGDYALVFNTKTGSASLTENFTNHGFELKSIDYFVHNCNEAEPTEAAIQLLNLPES